MPSDGPPPAVVKLPVLGTVGLGFASLRLILGTVLMQAFIIALMTASIERLADMNMHSPWPGGQATGWRDTWRILGHIVGIMAAAALSINFALGISRWVLIEARPTVVSLFRWGNRQWRLLGVGVLVGLLSVLPFVVFVVFLSVLAYRPPYSTVVVFGILAMVVYFWLYSCLCLVTPIVASDTPIGAIRYAWTISSGNRLRLMGLNLLFWLPAILVEFAFRHLVERYPKGGASLLADVMSQLIEQLIVSALIAAVAVAFRRINGSRSKSAMAGAVDNRG